MASDRTSPDQLAIVRCNAFLPSGEYAARVTQASRDAAIKPYSSVSADVFGTQPGELMFRSKSDRTGKFAFSSLNGMYVMTSEIKHPDFDRLSPTEKKNLAIEAMSDQLVFAGTCVSDIKYTGRKGEDGVVINLFGIVQVRNTTTSTIKPGMRLMWALPTFVDDRLMKYYTKAIGNLEGVHPDKICGQLVEWKASECWRTAKSVADSFGLPYYSGRRAGGDLDKATPKLPPKFHGTDTPDQFAQAFLEYLVEVVKTVKRAPADADLVKTLLNGSVMGAHEELDLSNAFTKFLQKYEEHAHRSASRVVGTATSFANAGEQFDMLLGTSACV